MRLDLLLAIALIPLGFLACDAGEPPDETVLGDVSGRWRVQGVTVVEGSGERRRIAGTIILVQEGDRYDATFDLDTRWPTEGTSVPADVIGVGEGSIEGRSLTGTARTQIVASAVPGVDSGFAFVPRVVSTRIVSTSLGRLRPDDTLVIEIESHPEPGQRYQPTRTRLTGVRVPPAGTPDVAAGPASGAITSPRERSRDR